MRRFFFLNRLSSAECDSREPGMSVTLFRGKSQISYAVINLKLIESADSSFLRGFLKAVVH